MTVTQTAKIKISGRADALTARTVREKVDGAVAGGANQLTLDVSELLYLSSAGLRVLGFVRQRLGDAVPIIVIGANETVKRTLRMVGLQYNLVLR
jgi:anti-anti-sigma factor